MSYSAVIKSAGLHGFGGECGSVAVAINRVIFRGKGRLVAASNEHVNALWRQPFFGHVAVLYKNRFYDATGEIAEEDFIEWGMVDPEDPAYEGLSDDQAHDAALFEINEHEAMAYTAKGQDCTTLRYAEGRLRKAIASSARS